MDEGKVKEPATSQRIPVNEEHAPPLWEVLASSSEPMGPHLSPLLLVLCSCPSVSLAAGQEELSLTCHRKIPRLLLDQPRNSAAPSSRQAPELNPSQNQEQLLLKTVAKPS